MMSCPIHSLTAEDCSPKLRVSGSLLHGVRGVGDSWWVGRHYGTDLIHQETYACLHFTPITFLKLFFF